MWIKSQTTGTQNLTFFYKKHTIYIILNLEILTWEDNLMAKREYEWFLKPTGNVAHTNEVLSRNISEENAMQDVLCQDGKKRDLWRCPSGIVFMLWRSRSNLKITFRIFSRELPNGKIRDCTFLFKNENGGKNKKKKRRSYAKF